MAEKYPTLKYKALREQTIVAFSRWKRRIFYYLGSCFVLASFATLFVTDTVWSSNWWFGFVMTFLISLIVVGYIPFVRRRVSLLACYDRVCEAFAKENSFTYIVQRAPKHRKLFRPSIEGTGYFPKEQQAISGQYGNYPFETFIYTVRHPFSSRFSRVATRVYSVTLPKRLPHIYLASRRATGTTFKTNTYKHFDDNQRIMLEGEFNKHFILYSHKRNRTEALSILAPNVMATMLDTNRNFNVEIIGDQLFLYSPDYLLTEEEARKGFEVLEAILKHLDRSLKSFKLVLPNNAKFPFLLSRPGFGTAVIGGKYFNASLFFIIWIFLVQTFRISFSDVSKRTKTIEFIVLASGSLFLIIFLLVLRQKNKSSLRAQ
jgi:hypothetical protein